MGWGSKQTTVSTNSSASTPDLNPLAQSEYSKLFPQANALIADANKPTYGDAAKADVLNNLNDLANSASKHLNSTLASTGQLNSGSQAAGQTSIEQQRYGQLSNFYSALPAAEQQAHQQKMLQALGFGAGLAGQMPVGNTSTSDGTQTQTSSLGLGSLVGSLLGSVGGSLMGGVTGGLGSMMSGGSFGSGFSGAMNPMGQFGQYMGYGAQPQLSQRPTNPNWSDRNGYGS